MIYLPLSVILSPPSLLSFFRLGLAGEVGPTNQPQQMFMPHRWEPPSPFSAADTDHRIPQVTDVRDLGVPLGTTFTASAHCREAANAARRLLFMVRRSFCELSKAAFIALFCALVRPHLEYAMEANAPTLRADINQLERTQRLATRLVRGLCYVPYEERLRQLNLFSLERISKVNLTLARLTSSTAHPEPVYEDEPTDYCKDQAVFDAGAVPSQFGL